MYRVLPALILLLLIFASPSVAPAQTGSTPVSVASFANPNFINGKIAQGMMFEIFGSNIALAGLNEAQAFPL